MSIDATKQNSQQNEHHQHSNTTCRQTRALHLTHFITHTFYIHYLQTTSCHLCSCTIHSNIEVILHDGYTSIFAPWSNWVWYVWNWTLGRRYWQVHVGLCIHLCASTVFTRIVTSHNATTQVCIVFNLRATCSEA